MPTITTEDGMEIFYKDWGSGQPIVFSHGWPLSADDWDAQMLFFLGRGYRVVAHDRRGHGRPQFYAAVLLGPAGRAVRRLQPARGESLAGKVLNWWRQGMMGGAKAHHDGIVAFSQTDFTDDLKKVEVPVLVMHGDETRSCLMPPPGRCPPSC